MNGIMVIQRTTLGAGFLQTQSKRYSVPSGKAMLFIHGESSSYGYDRESNGRYEYRFMSFVGVLLKPLFKQLIEQFGPVLDLPEASEACLLFDSVSQKHREWAFRDQYEASVLLYELVMALYRFQVEQSRERDCSVLAWNWIHHRFDQPFNMKELAARLGVSREHLTRKFKQTYGQAPAETLRNLRLERGRVLTKTTRLSLEDLARQSGYRDGNIFCRAYRKQFGRSPMQERRGG